MKNLMFVFGLILSLPVFASDLKAEKILADKVFHAECALSDNDSYKQDFVFAFNPDNNDLEVRANGIADMPAVTEKMSGDVITLKSAKFGLVPRSVEIDRMSGDIFQATSSIV